MKNLRVIEKSGKTVEEAVNAGLAVLGLTHDDIDYEIIDEGSKGFLGFGGKDSKVIIKEKVNLEKIAVNFLDTMVSKISSDVKYDITTTENRNIKINMSGPDMGILIGRRGDTLDSLQYLTSLVVNRYSEEYIKLTLDTENYRDKRYETLVRLARRLANQVVKTGKSITLEPMSPNERRIIHSTLQNNRIVTTSSIGEEPNRKVVISIGDKTYKI